MLKIQLQTVRLHFTSSDLDDINKYFSFLKKNKFCVGLTRDFCFVSPYGLNVRAENSCKNHATFSTVADARRMKPRAKRQPFVSAVNRQKPRLKVQRQKNSFKTSNLNT